MRVILRSFQFVHIDEIAFDYRVRQGSMICETRLHKDEVVTYIFEKPEYIALKVLRAQGQEYAKAFLRAKSWDYKVGSLIVGPIRRIKRLLE